jgi:hypothetical protein
MKSEAFKPLRQLFVLAKRLLPVPKPRSDPGDEKLTRGVPLARFGKRLTGIRVIFVIATSLERLRRRLALLVAGVRAIALHVLVAHVVAEASASKG